MCVRKIGDAGKPPTKLDSSGQFAALIEDVADGLKGGRVNGEHRRSMAQPGRVASPGGTRHQVFIGEGPQHPKPEGRLGRQARRSRSRAFGDLLVHDAPNVEDYRRKTAVHRRTAQAAHQHARQSTRVKIVAHQQSDPNGASAGPDALNTAIHHAVNALNQERMALPLAKRRTPA